MGAVKAGHWGQLWGTLLEKRKDHIKIIIFLHLLTKVTYQLLQTMVG